MESVDENGNVTYRKYTDGALAGFEIWFEYDEDGNCIYERNSQGYEAFWGYQDGYLVQYSNSNGVVKSWLTGYQPINTNKKEQ